MEIILSNQCRSLTGSLEQGFGYFIVNRKGRFYSVRSKHSVPPVGHLRFILTCAELAQSGLHIADIRVSAEELRAAFDEARALYGDRLAKANAKQIYNASQVLDFKKWI